MAHRRIRAHATGKRTAPGRVDQEEARRRGLCPLVLAGHGRFVAVAGTPGGRWRAPVEHLAPAADVARLGRGADCHLQDSGETAAGPDLPPAARRLGPTAPERGQTGQLVGREAAGSPRVGPLPQRLWAPIAAARHPLADRALADAQGTGDLPRGPALLVEGPGWQPSGFFPVVGGLRQASPCLTARTEL
jgi:hypothetical protein